MKLCEQKLSTPGRTMQNFGVCP
ncbi:hypothetical protein CBM2606_A90067 [Cupriavidus taiwanensis]|nr:hypothetical protein CBM2606_A90067 [Cupriavidus taiwanensis]